MDSNSALEIDDLVLRIERLIKRNENILGEYENKHQTVTPGEIPDKHQEEEKPALEDLF